MKKAFITGISGFAGNFLVRLLLQEGKYKVSGTYHTEQSLSAMQDVVSQVELSRVDLTNPQEIDEAISKTSPDVVFHLAALASPAQSFKEPAFTVSTNSLGQIHLLEAIKKQKKPVEKILVISSAEVYGLVEGSDLPIDEDTPMRPVSPYAVSKITQDFLGLQYYFSSKLPIVRVRPFNHIGPGQKPAYAVAAFASQIANIEKGKQEPVIHVGNLSARRDFTDVRDIVRAYVLLSEKGKNGEVYNVGSGVSQEMSKVLDMLISLSKKSISIEKDEARFMPVDIPDNRADITKLTTDTGWKPRISLERSLRDVLDYWRNLP